MNIELDVEKLARPVARRAQPESDALVPVNRYVRGAAVWLTLNFFQTMSLVSGFDAVRKAMPGSWHAIFAVLSYVGLLFLLFTSLRTIERLVEWAARRNEKNGQRLRIVLAGSLVATCIAAPVVYWKALASESPQVCEQAGLTFPST